MTFLRAHRKLHIWLLADLMLLAAFWIAREHRDWMNALADHVVLPLRLALSSVTYRVSFSVMEVLSAKMSSRETSNSPAASRGTSSAVSARFDANQAVTAVRSGKDTSSARTPDLS